ncbi:MAG TPA: transcription elongation factor GreA [Solirubrobacteraceae bacterium]
MSEPSYMTAEGLVALKAEIERLEGEGRNEIAEQIKTARAWGDLKENAEYHAAKDAQAHLETKILQLREQLLNARVVEAAEGGDAVAFGSTVEVEDESGGRRMTYRLVSAQEAAPSEGLLAFDSPVGSALRDKRVGDVAVVATPRGERRLKVVGIS